MALPALGGIDLHHGRKLGNRDVDPVLANMQVAKDRAAPALQPDLTPDPAGHEARTPVPAVMIRRFAGKHADPAIT
ncbi:hypothetical protein D3C76_998130 [compost metagenome]